jgi:putative transposase
MTIRFRLSKLDAVVIDGYDHRLQSQDAGGIVLQKLDDGASLSFKHRELLELLASPNVSLKRGHFSSARSALRFRCDLQYLNSLPPKKQAAALWKAAYCKVFLEAEAKGEVVRTEESIGLAIPDLARVVDTREQEWQLAARRHLAGVEITHRHPPSASTLRHWLRIFDKCGQSPLAFLRKRRSNLDNGRKLAAESEAILAECVAGYLSRDEPTQQMIVNATKTQFTATNRARAQLGLPALSVPSARTVRRRISRFDPFEIVARRKGIDAARRKFSFYETGVPVSHPLERVEMDEWQIDVASLFGNSGALDGLEPQERARFEVGRRWIYVAIDCATRCVVSLRIVANPSAADAIRALELITLDKTPIAEAAGCESAWNQFGGIGSLVTDQGSAFASVEFRAAVTDVGATYEAPPAGMPTFRSTIERLFGTLGQQLAPRLIGRTFSNPEQRGDYPSEAWASLTDDELAEIFVIFVVDIYHNTPHAGLQGETPANAWKRLVTEQGVTAPPDANARRVVFGIPLVRKLDRHGIRLFGIHYSSPDLQTAMLAGHARDIAVRVDPCDLTHISTCINGRWRPAIAVQESVRGLSLVEWQSIVREVRTKFRREGAVAEDLIERARARITAKDQKARELMRVQPNTLTPEALERLERNLFLGLTIKPDGSSTADPKAASGDLLDDVIGERPDSVKSEEPPSPQKPNSRGWKLLDD